MATDSEPWLLLPLLSINKDYGHYAYYWQNTAATAVNELIQKHQIEEEWTRWTRGFALKFYDKLATSTDEDIKIFIDKTPRYTLICNEIARVFPDAKFILLWRNPADIVQSMKNTWRDNALGAYSFKIDFKEGINEMLALAKKSQSRVYELSYEDFCLNPQYHMGKIYDFLGLSRVEHKKELSVIHGTMGDPKGQNKFKQIVQQSAKDEVAVGGIFQYCKYKSMMKEISPEYLKHCGYKIPKVKIEWYNMKEDLRFMLASFKDVLLLKLLRGDNVHKVR